ncbi:MAG: sigma-70 family RNA polymerase sigma factor [Oscillospiraceae bacterium]|nr:sigma-70 family RNA polymerase sigma factor [Oscillospiraceae bacterium]
MTIINLRDYYPIYKEDTFIEVSDEIATFLAEEKRLQTNYEQYIRDNKAFYSLDCGDGIEADALDRPEQPDEAYERAELACLLDEALASLPEAQRRRVYAHFIEQMSQAEIAKNDSVGKSTVSESISRGMENLKNFLKKFF